VVLGKPEAVCIVPPGMWKGTINHGITRTEGSINSI